MEINELLKLGFTSEQQYLEAKDALSKGNCSSYGYFVPRQSAYSCNARDAFDNIDYSIVTPNRENYPYKFDLTPAMPKVFDQGKRGTCVAQAMTALVEYYFENKYAFSPQFLYWAIKSDDESEGNLREWLSSSNMQEHPAYVNFVKQNLARNPSKYSNCTKEKIDADMEEEYRQSFCGASISNAKKVLENYGICEYSYMPYIPYEIFETESQDPDLSDKEHSNALMLDSLKNARKYRIKNKMQLLSGRSIENYKSAISGFGGKRPMPVVFSISMYNSWHTNYANQTGWFSAPLKGEKAGGSHAMLAVGYKDTPLASGGGYLIVRNSWGSSWAWDYKYKGYARIPYACIEHYADSLSLTIIEDEKESDTFKSSDILKKYIKVATKDMKNRKGRYAISKGQPIIIDKQTGKADILNEENCKAFINNGYSWDE